MRGFIAIAGAATVATAKIKWQVGDTLENIQKRRKLAVTVDTSTTDLTDESCIVGGYDVDHPERVYVGGPCSEIDLSDASNPTPKEKFRYIMMEVNHGGMLHGTEGSFDEVDFKVMSGSPFVNSTSQSNFAAIGTGATLNIATTHAGVAVSQMSYLGKADFTFKTNDFMFAKDKDTGTMMKMKACVAACCAPGTGYDGCSCPADESADSDASNYCSGTAIPVTPGKYKFSVFAASSDLYWEDGYQVGEDGNGWLSIVKRYGGTEKILKGALFIDQGVDFTNLKSDTITITKVDGTSVKYADMPEMKTCAVKGACTEAEGFYAEIAKVELASDEWSGEYTFPLTYTSGTYTLASESPNGVTTTKGTNNVKIFAVKPESSFLTENGFAATDKVLLLRYQFKIDGITAQADGSNGPSQGMWMAYDPTVVSKSASNAGVSTTTTTTTTGTGTGGSGSTNNTAGAGATGGTGATATATPEAGFTAKLLTKKMNMETTSLPDDANPTALMDDKTFTDACLDVFKKASGLTKLVNNKDCNVKSVDFTAAAAASSRRLGEKRQLAKSGTLHITYEVHVKDTATQTKMTTFGTSAADKTAFKDGFNANTAVTSKVGAIESVSNPDPIGVAAVPGSTPATTTTKSAANASNVITLAALAVIGLAVVV